MSLSIKERGGYIGKNNPNWKRGYRLNLSYSEEFNSEVKKEIRTIYRNTCQICGLHKDRRTKKRFAVHHIDHDKESSNKKNFIYLCVSCHNMTHNSEYKKYWIVFLRNKVRDNKKEVMPI